MKGPRIVASRLASLISIAVVLAAIAGGALADARSRDSGVGAERPHLLLVPATPDAQAELARTDARLVARYEAFSLVEARGADDERLRLAGAERRDDMRTVRTAAGRLDPLRARRSLAAKEAPDRDEVLALVQFVGPPKDAWLGRLRSTGARIVTYQAENSYVVHAVGGEIERVAALSGAFPPVRAVSVLTAPDKLEGARSASGRYAVQTVAGVEGREAREAAAAAGTRVSRPVTLDEVRTQYLALSAVEAADLARDPAVVAVEPSGRPRLADERGAQIVAGNLSGFAPAAPNYLGWLVNPSRIPDQSTFGFAIDVTDEGLDSGTNPSAHSDFRELGSASGASRLAYLNDYSTDTGATAARDCGGHGTHVASIAAGYNNGSGSSVEDGAGFSHGLGVAPFARLGASKIFGCGGDVGAGWTPAGLASNAYGAGARISNNSWGTGGQAGWGSYSTRAQQYDAVVRDASSSTPDNQELVEVFAAGNDGDDNPGSTDEGYGTILAEGTAKNVITVGAAEGVRPFGLDGCGVPDTGADSARDIVDFSSRGPTDDGRLKPDLVAPGSHILGARPRHGQYTGASTCNPIFGGTFYSLISGSSQAAPHVSGAAALVRHWYNRTQGADPSPALTKALLVNTATDLAGGSTGQGATVAGGPNTDQGWGRVNVGAALDSTEREFRDQRASDTFDASGQSVRTAYAVDDSSKPVKVTLAWTDAPGPASGNAWVNNLDLEVEARGDRYLGNVFGGSVSRPGGPPDTRNNVESVFLPAGFSGRFAVTVKGVAVGGDGVPGMGDLTDQDFALVVSNAEEQSAPVLARGTATTSDPAPEGDNDGFLESGERVELTQHITNVGTAGAGPMAANLSGSSSLTVTQPVSTYLGLAPGTSGQNALDFQAELANSATCGVDVLAALDITTTTPTPEVQSVPLVLATGEPGPAGSHDASAQQVPRAIPDDSGAGVSSTVFVSQRGRIKDLNVRLPGTPANPAIEHDWLGDVVIDLIGPDGTSVRLAEHPGGPDNGGKDFANVTFDDEAMLRLGPLTDPVAAQRPPYNGSFKPQNDQLSRFDGKERRGTWRLRVRDTFEGDTGTLRAWGLTSRRALCDFDSVPPDTRLLTKPANPSSDTSPTFSFDSPGDPGATFECRLDGGAFAPCGATQTYGSVAPGAHTFAVRAVDGSGNEDATPATFAWTIADFEAPVVRLTQPADGSTTADTTPPIAGVAGTRPGDDSTVTLKIWKGTVAAGAPVQTLIAPRSAAGGAFSAVPAALAAGTHTVRAEQGDAAVPTRNVGLSAPVTFTVRPVPAPPSFVLAPAAERMSDAVANRYTVLAACESACEVTARLRLSAAAARRLGLRARAVSIGSGVKRLSQAGAAAVTVGLTPTARAALPRRAGSRATLSVRVRDSSAGVMTLKRKVSLRRAAGLRRIRRSGMTLWMVCSKACETRGALRVSAARARRLGLKPSGTAPVTIASGRARGGRSPRILKLKMPLSAKKALRDATRIRAALEASAGSAGSGRRTARRALTLR